MEIIPTDKIPQEHQSLQKVQGYKCAQLIVTNNTRQQIEQISIKFID